MASTDVRAERIDPEDPLRVPAAPILEWYRLDASRRLLLVLPTGAVGMILGMFVVARLIYAHDYASLTTGALGVLMVIGSGAYTLYGTMQVLHEEAYLALRTDGVFFVKGPARRLMRWGEIAEVRHDVGTDGIVLTSDRGEAWAVEERFAGAANKAIAARIVTARRKALFGLFRAG